MQDKDTPIPAESEDHQELEVPREHRARVLKKAKVLFKEGLRSVPCVVRNISPNGARLEFEQAYLIPKEFELRIELEGFEVTCERRWEDGLACGVQFVSEKRPIKLERAQVLRPSDQALPNFRRSSDLDELASRFSAASGKEGIPGSVSPVRNRGKTFGKR
ncbi:PilZ domain-containing protein [Roseibium sp.]|uniref:PilZ domain-containing protein n=1 Tax=Roseibium sp. TaxID=1936156 RepID=UPI003A97C98E